MWDHFRQKNIQKKSSQNSTFFFAELDLRDDDTNQGIKGIIGSII
jgi:hypothetical protein